MIQPLVALILASNLLSLGAPCSAVSTQDGESTAPTIAVLGSSVASGWVTSREARQDLQNGWAQRLGRLLKPKGWRVANISVPGDDTRAALERIDADLLSLEPEYVIVALSMSNEGLETEDPEEVFLRYEEGLAEILNISSESGVQAVVGLCYPNDNFTEEQYETLHRMNLLIQSWPVPSIDFLGPLDDGHGNFVSGYTFDLDHPDDLGHQEMFHAVVPSLFEALERGKPTPERSQAEGYLRIQEGPEGAPISFVPEEVVHSFTVAFQVRAGDPGTLVAIDGGETDLVVRVEDDTLAISLGKEVLEAPANWSGEDWHEVVLTQRYLLGESEIWVDGESLGKRAARLIPRHFVLGGSGGIAAGKAPKLADYRDVAIYRTAWTQREVDAQRSGTLLQASLEVYAPLRTELPAAGGAFENHAQSLASLRYFPDDLTEALATIEARIATAGEEPRWIDPERIEPIELAPELLARYAGDYEVNPQMTIFVTLEKGRLILSPNHQGKIELHASSETEFFLRIMGPPRVPVVFVLDEEGEVSELLFDEGPYQLRGLPKRSERDG